VIENKCTHYGKCAEVCQYHAIVLVGQKMLIFPSLCHGCGSYTPICSEHAIREVPDVMGVLERDPAETGISFARGVLYFGEPMAVLIIRQLKRWLKPQTGQVEIVDAPPGTFARLWNPCAAQISSCWSQGRRPLGCTICTWLYRLHTS
jgi:MinD superfamily P-loop ATPase